MLLLKILMDVMKNFVTLLSHSEAFAALLLEVAENGRQPRQPGALAASSSQEALLARHCGLGGPHKAFFLYRDLVILSSPHENHSQGHVAESGRIT